MSTYITLDYLSEYIPTATAMAAARTLTYSASSASMSALGYDRETTYYGRWCTISDF